MGGQLSFLQGIFPTDAYGNSFFFKFNVKYNYLTICLAGLDLSCSTWNLSSPTSDQTQAPSIESMES